MNDSLFYRGFTDIRDTYDNPYSVAEFAEISHQLSLKFDFFIALGSAMPEWQIGQIEANPSFVSYVEGHNESDTWWQSFHGATGVVATQAVLSFTYGSMKSDPALSGVGVIHATFALPRSFAAYGDNSAAADYGSTQTYLGTENNPIGSDASFITLAQTVTPGNQRSRPRAATIPPSATCTATVSWSKPNTTWISECGTHFCTSGSGERNDIAATHFYTAIASGRSTILATRPGMVPEGVAFYAANA